MKLLKKQWFAFIILILAIGASIAIGYSRHEDRVINNDRIFQDADLDTSAILPFYSYRDNKKILDDDTKEKIQIYNANWEKEFSSVVWIETFDKTSEKYDSFAESESYKLGIGEKDALLILFKDSEDFVFYTSDDFPFSFDKQRAGEIIEIMNTAYDSDLDVGILKVYNKLNVFYHSDDVVFESSEDKKGGAFDDFFNNPSYDTFRESVDNLVSTYTDEDDNQEITCFSKKTEYATSKKTTTDDGQEVTTNSSDKKSGKGFFAKWKVVIFIAILAIFVCGRKKTSYK